MSKTEKVLSPAQLAQRVQAPLRHGARSEVALAPQVSGLKRALLTRMGVRERHMSWAARELVDAYCRAKAKVVAIDEWLEAQPMIDGDGNPAAVLKVYFVALNSSTRTLDALRNTIEQLAREDERFDAALAALTSEGARIRAGRGDGNG
jgi:hypothetical protein